MTEATAKATTHTAQERAHQLRAAALADGFAALRDLIRSRATRRKG